ncbi:hypothetical protein [Chromohalobacter moromii]|uniref:Uncharacterized protein n=1 Tax=Chromohalobacter moromii TaxID=2860329 RepID=A0A9X2X500_9GAMM|nr:hypothetical protein [Chromohalobacter moromii]MCK2047009.1 hypothetical protein [Chromohalobacter moromii]MCT8506586.1 hypothetical protein [Chromohalobacter moromii]
MKNQSKSIDLQTMFGAVSVSVDEAVRILGVHPKTAERWARGAQSISRERAALLAILSGQVVPMPEWHGFRFEVRRGPMPRYRPYAVLIDPWGREWGPSSFAPMSEPRQRRAARAWWRRSSE